MAKSQVEWPLAAVQDQSKRVLSNSCFYFPKVGDHVIGIVMAKNQEFFTLDIGAMQEATLPAIDGFRGATKRNRPSLVEGDVIFCQVTKITLFLEHPFELSCINANDVKQWSTKEAYFGQLESGFVFPVPLGMAIALSLPSSPILGRLSKGCKFEIAVGLNGRFVEFIKIHSQSLGQGRRATCYSQDCKIH
ncbi:bifunctional K Homology domain [Babesia duncani]|uniref:Bifunctional K Homology domain n=1 Tax=Babesia duncani TaxID=323732 RepID=A0AAD9PNC1_9APIC|nr:bifunctional K Homology domain [Babesia duncani]